MDFEQVLSLRRSVRRFQDKEIPDTLIDKMVRAGQCSPVGKADFSHYAIAVITDGAILSELSREDKKITGRGNPIFGAPLVFLILSQDDAVEDSVKLNAGIIAENIHLEAVNLGLASVCVYSFIRNLKNRKEDSSWLPRMEFPKGYHPEFAVAVGYPATEIKERPFRARIPVFR